MKLPIDLAGKLSRGEYRFRFTVTNGEVKVLSVSIDGERLDVGKVDVGERSGTPSGSPQNMPGESS